MWKDLPQEQKEEYQKMMLAFASLTEVFAQKSDSNVVSPIINSKFQETIFQKVFQASAEDIGNTSYDAAIRRNSNGRIMKYLIGIKTFGINSEAQKVAQFKANLNEWSSIINKIRDNSESDDGHALSKDEIDNRNSSLYLELAKRISILRNERIESSKANLQGFKIDKDDKDIESVYHVLMPSKAGDSPSISVGEIQYSEIDIDNIRVLGCTSANTPQNFGFTDGIHKYKFTSADCQLYMFFDNKNIIQDTWAVKYVEDAYSIFLSIAEGTMDTERITESYSWKITNKDGEVERYSGWNAFNGLGSKLSLNSRRAVVEKTMQEYTGIVPASILTELKGDLLDFLLSNPKNEERATKEKLRNKIVELAKTTKNTAFIRKITSLVFRPVDEMYIPIPNSKTFHNTHPNFFGQQAGTFLPDNPAKLALSKDKRQFNLVFEPSGDTIRAFITEDFGKAIESVERQTDLGKWVLRGIFQLEEYEPLTTRKLNELEINGLRLYKTNRSEDVHLQFIWIDDDHLPKDYIGK